MRRDSGAVNPFSKPTYYLFTASLTSCRWRRDSKRSRAAASAVQRHAGIRNYHKVGAQLPRVQVWAPPRSLCLIYESRARLSRASARGSVPELLLQKPKKGNIVCVRESWLINHLNNVWDLLHSQIWRRAAADGAQCMLRHIYQILYFLHFRIGDQCSVELY